MKFLGRRWLATLLGALLAPIAAAHAQTGKLTGIVTDDETGRPIEGAAVTVQGTTLGALTDARGRYFIIQVPPGRYSLQGRRIGYQSVIQTDVAVVIDVTREINFKLKASQTLQTVTVRAEQAPLIERGQVGSVTTITQEDIQSLPVTSIAGVLALQPGFQEIASNTNVISLAEEQRGTTTSPRIRGSRGGSSITMIDGVPINNPLFGSDAVTLSSFAIQGANFARGGLDAQYGNSLSGAVNQFVREGGTEVSGSINYRNSSIPGRLFNSAYDRLNGQNLLIGYLSGPVPGTSAKVRYSVSGQVEQSAARVLEFDQDIFSVNEDIERREILAPYRRDLQRGWQAFGGRQNSSISGKLTFLPFDNTKINVVAVAGQRANKNYERRYTFSYRGDPLQYVNNRADSLYVINDQGNVLSQDLSQPSVSDHGELYIASLEQRFGSNTQVQFRVGQTDFQRTTCPYFRGTCLPAPFCRANFAQGYINPSPSLCSTVPDQGNVDAVYGGEKFTSRTVRADATSQLSDHVQMAFGAQGIRHDIQYSDQSASAGNSGISPVAYQVYRAKPYDAAAYVQAVIEYDFLNIRLGGRFDYGRAKGSGFTNPYDPANGTTAREVCEGATVNGRKLANAQGQPYGTAGCFASAIDAVTKRPVLLDSATAIAQGDDFSEAKARSAFSPRLGVNFPLTERSQLFFNAGRYTRTPNYRDVYVNTGIGTRAGSLAAGGDQYCGPTQVRPGTNECVPNITSTATTFVGNPNLLLEEAKSYEVGYSTTLGAADNYGLTLALYNRSETGLTSTRPSRAVQDIGSTYDGSAPSYSVLVNGAFITARGLELGLERRLTNRWQYNINYTFARSTQSDRAPDRAEEIDRQESNRTQVIEALSDADQTHAFNLSTGFRVRNDIPKLPFNSGKLLRNSNLSVTYSFRTGVPYTPVRANSLANSTSTNGSADNLSGRQPSVQTVSTQFDKRFSIQNVQYSAFITVNNLFDRKNCNQVFANTGSCESGLRDFANRRIGNTGDANTSTAFDQPEYIGARRSINTGITITF